MVDAIKATVEALVPFPYQGHRRPDLTSRPLRFTTAGNFLSPTRRIRSRSGLLPLPGGSICTWGGCGEGQLSPLKPPTGHPEPGLKLAT
jgi:hypothetical protein